MSRLRRVLVGHNFFPDGEVAVSAARILAERADAMLYLLHVIEPPPTSLLVPLPRPPERSPQDDLVKKLHAELKTVAESPELAPLRVITEVRPGKPFVELIAACRRWPADVIVVGTSPRGEGRFLGSTTDRVLRKSPVPVLVAKNRWAHAPTTILISTDFSVAAQQAAEEGVAFAHAVGSRVVFVHVLERHVLYPPAYGTVPILMPKVTPADLEPEWHEFLHQLSLGGGLAWERRTCEGRAAESIVSVAQESGADLIVMGTHGRSALAHLLLGSVAEKVVRTAPCSVLTIRPDALHFELP
ncbi:MAG: universal stress protein [Candidatus Binatia bacterium]